MAQKRWLLWALHRALSLLSSTAGAPGPEWAMASGPEGQACSWRGLLPGSDPTAATRAGGPCPPFCSGASGQWALREVWLASRAGLRPPAVGLRCSRTVVPGAEVFSISVLPPTRLNLKPRVHPSAPLSPFLLLCSAAFLRRVHLQGRKWILGTGLGLGASGSPSAFLKPCCCPSPASGCGASVQPEASSLGCWLCPHMTHSPTRAGTSADSLLKPQDLAQCLPQSKPQQRWAASLKERERMQLGKEEGHKRLWEGGQAWMLQDTSERAHAP